MPELKGVQYLRNKLTLKRKNVTIRYDFYEMKNMYVDFAISTPKDLIDHALLPVLGWCAKAVDSLADRIVFKEFQNDFFNMSELYNLNNPDIIFDSAILSALISSCCFIYIAPDEDDLPRMRVIDGGNATGIIDPVTNMLTEGYAVIERDTWGLPVTEAYFIPGKTAIIQNGTETVYDSVAPYPLLVPVIFRPDAKREFGHSRISKACMSIIRSALRTIMRSEVSAEFYSFPQRYVIGTDPEMPFEKWSATISSFLNISKDYEGDTPTIGQFSQQSMEPHISQLRMFASLFAGETGLTLDDLGFTTENPSSADAIKASHENLRLTARKAQRTFASGFINAGYLAACIRDGIPYNRYEISETKVMWEPIFEPDSAMLSVIGDGVTKINNAVPNFFTRKSLEDLTGIKAGDENGL